MKNIYTITLIVLLIHINETMIKSIDATEYTVNDREALEAAGIYHEESESRCVQITQPVCQGLHYTKTYLPNSLGLISQEESARRMNDYSALLSIGCSRYLKFFLCTVYFPMCAPTQTALRYLQPCQEFCSHIQSQCEPIMKGFSFPWPKELSCDLFPSVSDVCIRPENYELDQASEVLPESISGLPAEKIVQLLPELNNLMHENYPHIDGRLVNSVSDVSTGMVVEVPGSKSKQQRNPKYTNCASYELVIFSEKKTGNVTCARRCSANVLYRREEKQFASIWIIIWSVLCFVSSALTVLSFIADRRRFLYPERPIVYISLCHLCYSFGYLLRVGSGYSRIACRQYTSNPLTSKLQSYITGIVEMHESTNVATWLSDSSSYLISPGYEGTWCTIVFIVLYYFSQASYVWWVMLAVAWFLSTVCQWGYEGIEAISSVLHMLAWSLPALQTMLILILHRIDADELTGLCHVGNQNPQSLLYFVIIPQITYLILGLVLLIIGFFALISVRTNLKKQSGLEATNLENLPRFTASTVPLKSKLPPVADSTNVRRLDKLMVKMCIFSMLYVVPSVCIIAAHLYAYNGYTKWMQALKVMTGRPGCLLTKGINWERKDYCLEGLKLPSAEINLLQMFMSLVIGITTGMWIWLNRKTFSRWKLCCQNPIKEQGSRETKVLRSQNKQKARSWQLTEHPCPHNEDYQRETLKPRLSLKRSGCSTHQTNDGVNVIACVNSLHPIQYPTCHRSWEQQEQSKMV